MNTAPPPSKIAGGHVSPRLRDTLAVWHAFMTGGLDLMAVRVYFACLIVDDRQAKYGPDKDTAHRLRKLTRASARRTREGLRDLIARGFVRLDLDGRLRLPDQLPPADDPEAFAAYLGRFPAIDRRLPIPKPILRLLASTDRGGAALIATTLGILIRCLYIHGKDLRPAGRCSMSWIADSFGIDVQAVERARAKLIGLGWISVVDTSRRSRNKHGSMLVINVDWAGCAPMTPPLASKCAPMTPPLKDKTPLRDMEKPEPLPEMVFSNKPTEPKISEPPKLRDISREDLTDPVRFAALLGQCHAKGLVPDTPHDRHCAARGGCYAARIGTNPGGLFAWMVGEKKFRGTDADDDAAKRLLAAQVRPDAVVPPLLQGIPKLFAVPTPATADPNEARRRYEESKRLRQLGGLAR